MSLESQDLIETDVLVVGGGLAGCWAALRAAELVPKVVLADKAVVARSGDAVFCHDILAPMPEDKLNVWLQEAVEHSEYLSDQRFGEVLLREEGDRIADMVKWGVPFEKDKAGNLFLSLGRGHKSSRVVLCDCRKLMEIMRREVLARGAKLAERVMVTELLTSDGQHPSCGRIAGALGIDTRSGKLVVFKAKAVVLCTGVTSLKLHTCFADNLTGDAQAMAFRAGAELGDMEFGAGGVKFTCVHNDQLIVSSLMPFQTQGAQIVNGAGERFMETCLPDRKERLATFGLLMQAATREVIEGRGPLFFDMRHFTPEHHQQMKRILPLRTFPLYQAGLNPAKDLIPCRVLLTYLGGGVGMDIDGEATVPGLLAGGIAAHFMGWSEGLSGAMLAFCNVFGYRAGERAAKIVEEAGPVDIDQGQVERLRDILLAPAAREKGLAPMEIYHRLNKTLMQPEFSVFRSESSINRTLEEIRRCMAEDMPRVLANNAHELVKANEARNFLEVLVPICIAALERKESRLSHYRVEYPYRDDKDWLNWVMVRKEDGEIKVRLEPVPVESNRIKPRSRERIPAPVQLSQQ
ncbi:MAG: FAD-binding protein [Thermodesulfobacteriota bacterium]